MLDYGWAYDKKSKKSAEYLVFPPIFFIFANQKQDTL